MSLLKQTPWQDYKIYRLCCWLFFSLLPLLLLKHLMKDCTVVMSWGFNQSNSFKNNPKSSKMSYKKQSTFLRSRKPSDACPQSTSSKISAGHMLLSPFLGRERCIYFLWQRWCFLLPLQCRPQQAPPILILKNLFSTALRRPALTCILNLSWFSSSAFSLYISMLTSLVFKKKKIPNLLLTFIPQSVLAATCPSGPKVPPAPLFTLFSLGRL